MHSTQNNALGFHCVARIGWVAMESKI